MRKEEALEEFHKIHPNESFMKDGFIDVVERRDRWDEFIKRMIEEGKITYRQSLTWIYPYKKDFSKRSIDNPYANNGMKKGVRPTLKDR